jgi:hypothetical protein
LCKSLHRIKKYITLAKEINKLLHKPNYLDAKMELGTQVQFFSFTLTQLCTYTMVLAFLTLILLFLIPTYYTEVLSLYTGSFVTMVVFYIINGTN